MSNSIRIFKQILLGCFVLLVTTTSVWQPESNVDRIRAYSRPFEFDFFGWTINAAWQKISAASLGPIRHLSDHQQRKIVKDYFQNYSYAQDLKNSLETLYADPDYSLKNSESLVLERKFEDQKKHLEKLAFFAETVIQDQVSHTLDELGLIAFDQPLPPVLYHITNLPKNLIISPRDKIIQEKSISLVTDISPAQEIDLESSVEENTGFSALVVPVGGVGTYPTMIISTGNLLYLVDTVAHEWTHNLLVFRPLGWNYSKNSALRTMNETAASIAGEEISWSLIRRYYGDLISLDKDFSYKTYEANDYFFQPEIQERFDFQKEMYQTRLAVDALLEDNEIEKAENYMEARRRVFWENGYKIRKLNQAYFAFYGAYADKPFSAAGTDPVGNDVRLLRARSRNLSTFIQKLSWMSSYNQLNTAVNSY